jgi:MoaE-MoaD fusion protein
MGTTLKIKLFATLKDLAGASTIALDLPQPATVESLKSAIAEQYPSLAPAVNSVLVAVNQEYAFNEHPVAPDDEIALFPPVSGGSTTPWPEVYHVAETPVDLNELTQQIVRPETGAIALFSGYVRGMTARDDQPTATSQLHYEAYVPMAEAKMQQVAAEIRERWPLVQGIAVVQRIGRLAVGEPTVLIACAAGHRDQGCFEAARYGIDRLKEIVPIWKKEIGPDGEQWIEGKYHPTEDDVQQHNN